MLPNHAGHAAIQRNLDRLGKWADRNLMKFKAKCKSSTWGGITSPQASQTALRALPAGWGRWSFPSTQHWWGHTWSSEASSGLPSTRDVWIYWGSCHTREQGLFSLEKRRLRGRGWGVDLINVCKYLTRGNGEEGARFLSVVTTNRTRGNEHKQKRFPIWNPIWTLFLLSGWSNTGTGCPEKLLSLHLWRYSKPNRTQPWTTCSTWPCLSRRFGLDNLKRSLPT